ncbi:hypothetical protein BQ8794_200260 [Mesorhizobium prunaredense]|uniref:Uncharacterized protein n=1 Tax=Mesorhizobium prunaredense TaxID=1631249 RepID=A0A1R3V8Y8_9HYPH|nr:hypothetical protein BQ8794_200260 [Mesorhizobium prunaredense]
MCNSPADMVSKGLPLGRPIEPVVNLLVPQPATLAASAIMNAVVISRFPLAFVMLLVGICTKASIRQIGYYVAIFPPAEIFC